MSKNPYDPETPHWQLYENMRSNELLTVAYAADAERYTKLSQRAREKAETFKDALAKLEAAEPPKVEKE